MCGIAGILRTDGQRIPETWLDRLDDRIRHRGPDGDGRFRSRVEYAAQDKNRTLEMALVHRRLSIIDPMDGAQPMVSERGRNRDEHRIAVVFNGCIYNHRELRAELESADHAFETDHSDTEVLVHGYRQWGASLAQHLEGMYAFAIWDEGQRRLMLARDLFGEKPLYVRWSRGRSVRTGVIAFASMAGALAGLPLKPLADAHVNLESWLHTYLLLGYAPHDQPIPLADRGQIVQVDPGETVIVHAETGASESFAHKSIRESDQDGDRSFEDLIEQSVAARLEADVPLGCFLSGGIDSSLIAHFASKHRNDLQTFCVRMPDSQFDESPFAQRVAVHLGTAHTTLDVNVDPAADITHLVSHLGQPFSDSSILPTYWVSQAARQHVHVALSGDGGDELFFGYERYVAARVLATHHFWLRMLPRERLYRSHVKSFKYKLARLSDMARQYQRLGLLSLEAQFSVDQIVSLTGDPPARDHWIRSTDDPARALRDHDLSSYLPDDLLRKVDTASMAVALEVRCPFLDRQLARKAMSTATATMMPRGRRKWQLKQLAKKLLPAEIINRPKMGFAIPIGSWFRNDYGGLRQMMLDHLTSTHPFGPFELDRKAVRLLIDEHLERRRDHGHRLFALLTLSLWANAMPGTQSPAQSAR